MAGRVPPSSLSSVAACSKFLEDAWAFIESHRNLIEAHGNDIKFLSEDHFGLLPAAWGPLIQLSIPELINLPMGVIPSSVAPDLQSFVQRSLSCQLSPFPDSADDVQLATNVHVRHFLGTTEKKREEMLKMAQLIADVARGRGIAHVVDIGCGKGYLSTLLAAAHKLSVLGIEQSEETASAANERDENVRRKLPKASAEAISNLKIRAARVKLRDEPDCVAIDTLLDEEGVEKTILVGLHICGDLLPDCIRYFVGCSRIDSAVLCGCCYNMLTETEAGPDPMTDRFPLSDHCQRAGVRLGRRLRNAACNSVFEWPGQAGGWVDRVVYTSGYRAVLGLYMHENALSTSIKWGRTFQNVKRKPQFGVWAFELLSRHCEGHDSARDSPGALQLFYDQHRDICNSKILAFEAIAGVVLPVLESLIVVDRLLFLLEHQCPATLVALFDPASSPRNWVLIAGPRVDAAPMPLDTRLEGNQVQGL